MYPHKQLGKSWVGLDDVLIGCHVQETLLHCSGKAINSVARRCQRLLSVFKLLGDTLDDLPSLGMPSLGRWAAQAVLDIELYLLHSRLEAKKARSPGQGR